MLLTVMGVMTMGVDTTHQAPKLRIIFFAICSPHVLPHHRQLCRIAKIRHFRNVWHAAVVEVGSRWWNSNTCGTAHGWGCLGTMTRALPLHSFLYLFSIELSGMMIQRKIRDSRFTWRFGFCMAKTALSRESQKIPNSDRNDRRAPCCFTR